MTDNYKMTCKELHNKVNMTCEELHNKIKMFNEDKKNWYRKQTGYGNMLRDKLIALCDKCDEARKIKKRRQLISYKDLFEMICNEEKKLFKNWEDYGQDWEEEFIEIEYEWDNFANCRPYESAVTFIIPYGENDEKKCCLKKVYNTSSPFALWICNFDENESDGDEEDD
jgi:hypothetical protein